MYDSMRIEQLLENLVENALKCGPEGGTVEVTVMRAGRGGAADGCR
ncbi:MAG: hypothetical protein RLZZ387_1332 [Chloroflexota bacterium]